MQLDCNNSSSFDCYSVLTISQSLVPDLCDPISHIRPGPDKDLMACVLVWDLGRSGSRWVAAHGSVDGCRALVAGSIHYWSALSAYGAEERANTRHTSGIFKEIVGIFGMIYFLIGHKRRKFTFMHLTGAFIQSCLYSLFKIYIYQYGN